MAFCNSCGATLNTGAKFCNKCGTPIAAGAAPSSSLAPASTGGSSALKIILIVVAIIVGLGILGIAGIGIFAYHVAKNARVHQEGNNVKVETPFGNVETTEDPDKAAQNLGVDIYPGAQVQKNGTSSVTFGSMHTVTATFESSDSPDQICAFYKPKFPNAMVTTADQNRCTVVSNDQKNMITINIEPSGDGTKFQITSVSKKSN